MELLYPSKVPLFPVLLLLGIIRQINLVVGTFFSFFGRGVEKRVDRRTGAEGRGGQEHLGLGKERGPGGKRVRMEERKHFY